MSDPDPYSYVDDLYNETFGGSEGVFDPYEQDPQARTYKDPVDQQQTPTYRDDGHISPDALLSEYFHESPVDGMDLSQVYAPDSGFGELPKTAQGFGLTKMGFSENEWVNAVLDKNKDKPFVDRVVNYHDYPVLDLGEGKEATHLMAYSDEPIYGKYPVFPLIVMDDGELVKKKPRDAFKFAVENNNFIMFDTSKEAEAFSKKYKSKWDEKQKQEISGDKRHFERPLPTITPSPKFPEATEDHPGTPSTYDVSSRYGHAVSKLTRGPSGAGITLKEGSKDVVKSSLGDVKGQFAYHAAVKKKAYEGWSPRDRKIMEDYDKYINIPPLTGTNPFYQHFDEEALDKMSKGIGELIKADLLSDDPEFVKLSGFAGYGQDVVKLAPQIMMQFAAARFGGGRASMKFMASQIAGGQYLEQEDSIEPIRNYTSSILNAYMQAPMEQFALMKVMKKWTPTGEATQVAKVVLAKFGSEFFTEWFQKYPELGSKIWARTEGQSMEKRIEMFWDGLLNATWEGMYEGLITVPFALLGMGASIESEKKRIDDVKKSKPMSTSAQSLKVDIEQERANKSPLSRPAEDGKQPPGTPLASPMGSPGQESTDQATDKSIKRHNEKLAKQRQQPPNAESAPPAPGPETQVAPPESQEFLEGDDTILLDEPFVEDEPIELIEPFVEDTPQPRTPLQAVTGIRPPQQPPAVAPPVQPQPPPAQPAPPVDIESIAPVAQANKPEADLDDDIIELPEPFVEEVEKIEEAFEPPKGIGEVYTMLQKSYDPEVMANIDKILESPQAAEILAESLANTRNMTGWGYALAVKSLTNPNIANTIKRAREIFESRVEVLLETDPSTGKVQRQLIHAFREQAQMFNAILGEHPKSVGSTFKDYLQGEGASQQSMLGLLTGLNTAKNTIKEREKNAEAAAKPTAKRPAKTEVYKRSTKDDISRDEGEGLAAEDREGEVAKETEKPTLVSTTDLGFNRVLAPDELTDRIEQEVEFTRNVEKKTLKSLKPGGENSQAFAEELAEGVDGMQVFETQTPVEHTFVKYEDVYYDAAHPQGVDTWQALFEEEETTPATDKKEQKKSVSKPAEETVDLDELERELEGVQQEQVDEESAKIKELSKQIDEADQADIPLFEQDVKDLKQRITDIGFETKANETELLDELKKVSEKLNTLTNERAAILKNLDVEDVKIKTSTDEAGKTVIELVADKVGAIGFAQIGPDRMFQSSSRKKYSAVGDKDTVWRLFEISVDDDLQGKGFGKMLFDAVYNHQPDLWIGSSQLGLGATKDAAWGALESVDGIVIEKTGKKGGHFVAKVDKKSTAGAVEKELSLDDLDKEIESIGKELQQEGEKKDEQEKAEPSLVPGLKLKKKAKTKSKEKPSPIVGLKKTAKVKEEPEPKVVPKVKTETSKEPWEMTKDEFAEKIGLPASKSAATDQPESWYKYQSDRNHKGEIARALKEGKFVSAEVLKDYPDLKPKVSPEVKVETSDLDESALIKSYFELSGGEASVRINLSDLREKMPHLSRSEFDKLVLRVQNENKDIHLDKLGSPVEVTSEIAKGAIDLAGGFKRHIVYMDATASIAEPKTKVPLKVKTDAYYHSTNKDLAAKDLDPNAEDKMASDDDVIGVFFTKDEEYSKGYGPITKQYIVSPKKNLDLTDIDASKEFNASEIIKILSDRGVKATTEEFLKGEFKLDSVRTVRSWSDWTPNIEKLGSQMIDSGFDAYELNIDKTSQLVALKNEIISDIDLKVEPEVKVTGTEKDKTVKADLTKKEEKALTQTEVKKYLIAEIDEAIKTASEEISDTKDFVTIEVPNDGEFNVLNVKSVLETFKKQVKKAQPKSIPGMAVPSIKPSQARMTFAYDGEEGNYYNPFRPRKKTTLIESDNQFYADGMYWQGAYVVKMAKPKLKKPVEKNYPKEQAEDILEDAQKEGTPAEIVGEFSEGPDVKVHVVTEDNKHDEIDARFVDIILTKHPNAKVSVSSDNNVIFKDSKGDVVGIVSPYSSKEGFPIEEMSEVVVEGYERITGVEQTQAQLKESSKTKLPETEGVSFESEPAPSASEPVDTIKTKVLAAVKKAVAAAKSIDGFVGSVQDAEGAIARGEKIADFITPLNNIDVGFLDGLLSENKIDGNEYFRQIYNIVYEGEQRSADKSEVETAAKFLKKKTDKLIEDLKKLDVSSDIISLYENDLPDLIDTVESYYLDKIDAKQAARKADKKDLDKVERYERISGLKEDASITPLDFPKIQTMLKGANAFGVSAKDPNVMWVQYNPKIMLHIRFSDEINEKKLSALEGYDSTLSVDQLTAGKYSNLNIELHRILATEKTAWHELIHFFEEVGIIGGSDIVTVKKHVQKLIKAGTVKANKKEKPGGSEDRAYFISEAIMNRQAVDGPVAKIVQKIQDFIDALLNLFGVRTAASVVRDVQSGSLAEGYEKKVNKQPYYIHAQKMLKAAENAEKGLERYSRADGKPSKLKTAEDIAAAKEKIDQFRDSIEEQAKQIIEFSQAERKRFRQVAKGGLTAVPKRYAAAISIQKKINKLKKDLVGLGLMTEADASGAIDDAVSHEFELKTNSPQSVVSGKTVETGAGPVTFAETQEPLTDSDYVNNRKDRKNVKLSATTAMTETISEIVGGLDKFLGTTSTRLGNISKKLKHKYRRLDSDINTKTAAAVEKVAPLLKKAKSKMSRDDYLDWDYARKNSDTEKIDELIKKYSLRDEYIAYRETLDGLRAEGVDVGLEIGLINEYAPRILKNTRGFLKEMGKAPEWPIYTRRLQERAMEMGISVSDMTPDMKASLISNMILFNETGLGGIPSSKKRKIQKIPPRLNKFYMDSDSALMSHINSMVSGIEARKFFGKIPQRVSAIRTSLHRTQAEMRSLLRRFKSKKETPAEMAKIKKRLNGLYGNARQYKAYLEQYALQRDYTENIGSYINELIIKKEIQPQDEKTVQDILSARFHAVGTRGIVQAYKNLSYIDTMGSQTSALTQVGDLTWALYEAEWAPQRALKNAFKSLVGRSNITRKDLGLELIAQEFADPGTFGKAVSKVFKWVGLEKIDAIGKEALANTAHEKYMRQAKKDPEGLKAELLPVFEQETDSVIEDLVSGEVTQNVKLLIFNRILDFQPVALSEMPQKYLTAGNGRIFYMLKTFTLKQFDVARNESYNKIKNGNRAEKIQGVKNLVRLAFYFVLCNAGADELKDLLLGRKTDISDRVVDNILRLFGVSKFITWQARTEGIGTALAKQGLPPFKFINALTKDLITFGDGKGFETLASLPVMGKLLYWHIGRGVSKREDLWDRRFRKEKKKYSDIKEEYDETPPSDKQQFAAENRREIDRYDKIKALQGTLNSYKRRINLLEKFKKTDRRQKEIDVLKSKRTELIKRFLSSKK